MNVRARFLSLLMVAALALTMSLPALAAVEDTGFSDVTADAWYADAVEYVRDNGLMSGASTTAFSPNTTMTRAMLVTVLYRIEGKPSVEGLTHPFQDVPTNSWYNDAIIWAYNNGIISGISTTAFAPNSNTTRQQIAAILYRYAKFRGYNTGMAADLTAFPDSGTIADYAKEPMAWANAAGLIQGSLDGENLLLLPNQSATRAQLAAILMRFMKIFVKG